MTDLLKWQWLVFLLPLALAALLAIASALGLAGDHDADTDASHDHDLDGADQDAESEHDAAPSWLGLLGVGYAPLSVLLICLLTYWAVIGSLGNYFLGSARISGSIGLALVGSLVATAGTARLIRRFFPLNESYSVGRHELIGQEGVAIYPITETSGTVRLHDKLGTLRQLDSRIAKHGATIPENTRVVVVDYDRESQVFTVQCWDDLVGKQKEEE